MTTEREALAPPDGTGDEAARRLLASIRDTAESCCGMIARLAHGAAAVRHASRGRERTETERQALKVAAWAETEAKGLASVGQAAADVLGTVDSQEEVAGVRAML